MAEITTLSILLPVRNEGINLKLMLNILRAVAEESHEVIVIHDTSDDDSIPVVREIQKTYPELHLVHNTLGRGVVNAIRAGVEAAKGEYVLIFAADEVGPVLAIEDMLVLMKQGCDFVSCTRYAHGGRRLGGSVIGGILSRSANWFFHRLSGSPFSDATTGIKMFRRDIFPKLNIQCRPVGWAVAFEMAYESPACGSLFRRSADSFHRSPVWRQVHIPLGGLGGGVCTLVLLGTSPFMAACGKDKITALPFEYLISIDE